MVKIPAKVRKQIKAYIDAVEGEWNISLVILFGSYAKGRWHRNSDIDLAIVSDQFESPPSISVLMRLQDLKWGIAPDVEPLAIDMSSYKKANDLDFIGGVVCHEGVAAYRNGRYLM